MMWRARRAARRVAHACTGPAKLPAVTVGDRHIVDRLAGRLGFALVGIVPAEPSAFAAYIRRWLGQAKHGQMDYLAKNLQLRLDPQALLAGARSVVCVADRYPATQSHRDSGLAPLARASAETGSSVCPPPAADAGPEAVGRVARFAWGDDYHRVMKKRLFELTDALRQRHPDHQYRVAVDTAPILEREHAARAGLGWIGKHTLLIHPRIGSWLLLGEIVTTLSFDTAAPPTIPSADHCGTCTRCIDACPTGCISPYQLDAQSCISYLTIEHRGPIDPHMQPMMGDWIAGCDVCQEVCPFNRQDRIEGSVRSLDRPGRWQTHRRYATRPPGPAVRLIDVLGWDTRDRQEVFKGSALKRIKLDMLKRNALIAAGNYLTDHQDAALHDRVRQVAKDPDESPLIRLTAGQVLDRLDAEFSR